MPDFREIIDAAAVARAAYEARCLDVWRELQVVEPAPAAQILLLGIDEATAADWACRPIAGDLSPAELVAAGRGNEVLEKVSRTMHGVFG